MQPHNRPLTRYNLTAEEIAEKLGYNVQYVRTLAASGKLPAIKRFRQWLFDEQEVFEALRQETEKATDGKDTKHNGHKPTSASDLLR